MSFWSLTKASWARLFDQDLSLYIAHYNYTGFIRYIPETWTKRLNIHVVCRLLAPEMVDIYHGVASLCLSSHVMVEHPPACNPTVCHVPFWRAALTATPPAGPENARSCCGSEWPDFLTWKKSMTAGKHVARRHVGQQFLKILLLWLNTSNIY